MTTATLPDDLAAMCRRVIWWEQPEEAVHDRRRLLTYVMAKGTWDDITVASRYFTEADFRGALHRPAPGVFDPRSWRYWHLRLGVHPEPPLPRRRLP